MEDEAVAVARDAAGGVDRTPTVRFDDREERSPERPASLGARACGGGAAPRGVQYSWRPNPRLCGETRTRVEIVERTFSRLQPIGCQAQTHAYEERLSAKLDVVRPTGPEARP